MKTFALAAFVAVASANEVSSKFMEFIVQHGKSYATVEEFNFRKALFAETEAAIQELNASETSVHGHNKFSDYTRAEYKKLLGFMANYNESAEPVVLDATDLPASVNWVEAGAVTPVKDQGQCGSCWAFSSTGALEGAHQIASGELLSFSEQQLVDCVQLCFGCNGGNQALAFRYLESHDIELESAYPYTAKDGDCAYNEASATAVDVSDYTMVTSDSVEQMKAALAQQPLSVSIEADKLVFQTYTSGVLSSTKCGTQLDHAVLAVGYGTEDGQDYWLVKNSWGTSWGEDGYIKLAIVDGDGICGVQMGPLYPTANQ